MKSILIKDTTREEREEIIRSSLDCVRKLLILLAWRRQSVGYLSGLYRRQKGDQRDQYGI